MRITVLGMGAMGSRMAKNWLAAGAEVNIWNRTQSACDAVVAAGATAYQDPAEAVKSADYVISMLRDNAAVENVWLQHKLLQALPQQAIVIESSTLSPDFIVTLNSAFQQAQKQWVEAPVIGTLPQVENGQLNYLLAGPQERCESLSEVLAPQANRQDYVGDYGNAARLKLAVNSLLAVQVAALSEILSGLETQGISKSAALEVLNRMATSSPAAQGMGKLMELHQHRPLFPIALVEKDMGYAKAIFNPEGAILPATHALFERAVKAGFGHDNISGLIQLFSAEARTNTSKT